MIQDLETDVLILGGGLAGMVAAHYARRNDIRVILVDKNVPGKSGSSAKSVVGGQA